MSARQCSPRSEVQIVSDGHGRYFLWDSEQELCWDGEGWDEMEKTYSSISAAFQKWLRKIAQ